MSDFLYDLQYSYSIKLPFEFCKIAKANSAKLLNGNCKQKFSIKAISGLSEQMSGLKNEEDLRAKLIWLLNKESLLPDVDNSSQFNTLFIDDNKQPIKYSQEVFTHKTKDAKENVDKLPTFVNVNFLNFKLSQSLLKEFNCEGDDRYRQLQRELKEVLSLHSYEPMSLIQKIISDTKNIIAKEPTHKINNVKLI